MSIKNQYHVYLSNSPRVSITVYITNPETIESIENIIIHFGVVNGTNVTKRRRFIMINI